MPAIDTNRSKNYVPRKRRAAKPKPKPYSLPPKFRTEAAAPAPKRPKFKPSRKLPTTFRTEAPTRSEGTARADKYRKSDAFTRDLNKAAKIGYKDANTKAEKDRRFGPTGGVKSLSKEQRRSILKQEGLGLGADTSSKLYKNILTDTKELVTGTPASVYLTAHAGVQAAKGHPGEAKKLWKNFKDTDALALAAQGKFKEAGKAAFERPVSTGLELSGVRAGIGRTAGAAARKAPSAAIRKAGFTERADLRLYKGSLPGEGPAIGRRYSKDLITKGVQVAVEKNKRRRGIDPNIHHERAVKNLSGGESRPVPSIGPVKHPLDDRVDRHVHAQHVMQQQVVQKAERAASRREKKAGKKNEPSQRATDDAAAQKAKEYTANNPSVQGLNPEHVAHHAHDVLGLKKPVSTRLMPIARQKELTDKMGNAPRAYTQDMGNHYKIEINPQHPGNKGPKGVSNAMHYELGRAQGLEKGKHGPGAVGSEHNRAAYFDNQNTKHAQAVLRTHVGTDLRRPPVMLPERQFTGSPRATRTDEAGQEAARAALQTHMKNVAQDFSVRIGEKGFVGEHKDAVAALPLHEAKMGEKLIPVNVARLTRVPKEPVTPRTETPRGLQMANSNERAWKAAVEQHGNGQWVLMPERVVKRFVQHAENSRKHGALQRSSNLFKDVVLTTGNPVRWLGGNVTDLGMRAVNEGLTPVDLYRGARAYKELGKHGRKGELVKASTMGGGFGHLARDVSREVSTPGASHLAKVWGKYRGAVYGLESAIESLPQMATVGKEMRTASHGGGVPVSVKGGLKGLLRATDDQVQHFAKNMATDPATEMRVAKHVEDVIGSWGKLSPESRRLLAAAPFAQWLGAATKYVMVTLPTKHPIKTGIAAALNQMTEKERAALGLSQYLPLKDQAQDYQMMTLPQKIGKDKYGPVVKGTDVARALSMGTVSEALDLNVGGYLFPQFSGALDAAKGSSWTGEPLKYPEGHPNAGMPLSSEDRRKTAIGMLIETMVPGASMYRRVVQEKGRPSMPQSTILDPQVRQKYDAKKKALVTPQGSIGAGIKRATGAPIPGLPAPKRVYTKGAINQIDRSRTAINEVKKWNAERKTGSKKTGDPELDAFGAKNHKKNKDAEVENFR